MGSIRDVTKVGGVINEWSLGKLINTGKKQIETLSSSISQMHLNALKLKINFSNIFLYCYFICNFFVEHPLFCQQNFSFSITWSMHSKLLKQKSNRTHIASELLFWCIECSKQETCQSVLRSIKSDLRSHFFYLLK